MAGFWERLLGGVFGVDVFTPRVTHFGVSDLAGMFDPAGITAASMWKTQPHFRTVVEFVARNIAQLGLHTFERVDETDRRRDRTSTVARLLRDVDGEMTGYDLRFALVGDLLLYDRAYWLIGEDTSRPSGYSLRRLPPAWVEPVARDVWGNKSYRVYGGGSNKAMVEIPAEKVLAFSGYSPSSPTGCSPTVEALKGTLLEQIEASTYRAQIWRRGGRVSSVIERPADAPAWSDEAAERFREDWYAKYTGKGDRAGGTPILEDGMSLKRIDFNAQEQQFVEAAKLSLTTVAAAFHVNPTMIGQNEGANYSNVREFRKMLYGDTLGPTIARIEDRINTFLFDKVGQDRDRFYVEFNIEEKLQGNFEEQVIALQSSVGGPYMTRNEARAMRNLPAIDGGDDLIVPLNVITGGQASPRDSGSQNRASRAGVAVKSGPVKVKAAGRDEDVETATDVLREFFKRQRAVVLTRLGAKAPDWWDQERWDDELADDLLDLSLGVTAGIAADTLRELGLDAGDYSPARTVAFLRKVATSRASMINGTTLAQLEAALADDLEEDALKATPEGVFEEAMTSRSEQAGMTLATTLAGFAVTEALRQIDRPGVTKTWITTSGNPRPEHAVMDGETVPLDDAYSNGMMWPGDIAGAGGDPDQIANCSCVSEMTIP